MERTVTTMRRRAVLVGLLAWAACRRREPRVSVELAPWGVAELRVDGGPNLLVGGAYLIASETGEDDPDRNYASNAGTMRDVPWTFEAEPVGSAAWRLRWRVGPLPRRFQTCSVPLDLDPTRARTWAFAEGPVVVGCADSWAAWPGTTGRYDALPQPCPLTGSRGWVGLARVPRPVAWLEATLADGTRIRRVPGPTYAEAWAVRHPGTHNLECSWAGPAGLPAGSVLDLDETLVVVR